MSLSIRKLKQGNFWPTHKTEVVDPRTKKKSSSNPTLKPTQFQSKLILTPSLKIKSISIPIPVSSLFWCPDTKPSWFLSWRQKQEFFDRYTKTKSMPILHIEMESFSTNHTTTKSISSYTGITSSSIPRTEIKPIWTTHTKTKSLCMPNLKTCDFRPAYKLNKSTSTTHTTTRSISSLQWNQVKLDPPHWDQINFDRYSENHVSFHARTKIE